jgi:hypothetical protein
MVEKTFQELYQEFQKIASSGSEEQARQFLIDNLPQFPEEVRKQIVFAFFEEGLEKAAEGESLINNFQKRGLEAVKTLEELKRILEDKKGELELKQSLAS